MTVAWFDGVTFTVEVGFASAPSVAIASTTWTDVSAYVRGLSTSRGRNDELAVFQAGTMSVTLANQDRRFDPNNAAGPYFGNLLPNRRVRVKATYSGTTYAMWCGYVDDWPQSYDIASNDAFVDVKCSDGFKPLANITLPESYWAYLITTNTIVGQPVAWYRLGDQSGTVCTDSIGAFNGTYQGGATFNTRTGLISKTTDNAIGFDGVDDSATLPASVTTMPYTVAFSFQAATASATGRLFTHTSGVGLGKTFNIRLNSGNLVAEQIYTDGSIGNVQRSTTSATYNDNGIHHCMVVFNSFAAPPTIFVDGAAPSVSTAGSGGTTAFPDAGTMYLATDLSTPFAVTIDEVAIFASDASAEVSDFYLAASAQEFTNERAVDGIPVVLGLVGWPVGDENIDTALTTEAFMWLDAVAWPGPKTVLSVIQQMELTDNGQFFMGADGKATYRAGYYRYTTAASNTSQATFGDSGGELPYAGIVVDGGANFLRNRVRVSTENYSTQQAFDATSIAAYLEWSEDIAIGPMATVLDTTGYRTGLANWKVAQFKNPINRVTDLSIRPRGRPASLFPQVLGRDIGDRVTVKRRPPGGGAVNTFTVLVEGITHDITAQGDWVTTWFLSSADTLPMMILDDAVLGVLDTAVLAF